jgi:hypothetical protein
MMQGFATGPGRARTQLALLGHGVSGVLSPSRQLQGCMSVIPSDVLGGSIEAMFSTCLRGCFPEGHEQKDIVGQKRPKSWADIQQDIRESWGKGETQLPENESRRHMNLAPGGATGQGGNEQSIFGNNELTDMSLPSETGVWLPKTEGLTQALREYEQLTQSQDKRFKPRLESDVASKVTPGSSQEVGGTRGGTRPATTWPHLTGEEVATRLQTIVASKDTPGSSQEVGGTRGGTRPATTWPHLTGEEVAARLQAFVANTSREGHLPTANGVFSTSSTGHGLIQNSFHIQVTMGGRHPDGAIHDLSEQIAGVLREQASQYGIDLT